MARNMLPGFGMSVRHTLTLLLLLSGCYLHHQVELGEDCGPIDTFVEGLFCPEGVFRAGDTVSVEFHHRVASCCESGTNTSGVDMTLPAEWNAWADWQACGCNALLDCIGPQEISTLRIGPLLAGTNVVRADGFECFIEAEPMRACGVLDAPFIAPRVLFDDQAFATTLTQTLSGDCGCSLDIVAEGREIGLRLCECGEVCDAAEVDVSGSYVGDTHDGGMVTYAIGGAPHVVDVVAAEEPGVIRPGAGCRPIAATGLQFAVPTGNHVGPRLVWAGITGEQSLCCSPELRLAARTLSGDRRTIELQLYTCTIEDCLCMLPPPTVATAWHNLGELAPGDYVVRAGDMSSTLTVF